MIGAGLAGLSAAHFLVERGYDVTVLEATDRPGGRIHTIRAPWRDGLYVEAGATHVVGDPDLLALFAAMSVAVEPRRRGPKGLSEIAYLKGKRLVLEPGKEAPSTHVYSKEEEALGFEGRMKKYFAASKGYDPTGPIPDALLPLDSISAAEYLRRQGASPGFVSSIDEMFIPGDGGIEGHSALSMLREHANIQREIALRGGGRVAGGADRLPAAIAQKLGSRVIYGAPVRAVHHDDDGVRVIYLATKDAVERTITADRAILAIPPTVLRSIPVIPLSPDKQHALREIALESVVRVWAMADQRFWLARGESGTADTDLPIGRVRDETEGQNGTAGVLGIYDTRAQAKKLAKLNREQRVQAMLADVEDVHPGMKDHFVAGASKAWDEEPYQLGAYAYFKPGQLTGLLPHLMRAEGRLHFAGDHTSWRPGFMHGALASAKRVVDEITRAG